MDCVGQETLALRGTAPLQACLEAQEFVWAPRGDDSPPVALFAWPTIASPEVEIEFLAPARGDGLVRVVELQKGVTAQTLRDVDILLPYLERELETWLGQLAFERAKVT